MVGTLKIHGTKRTVLSKIVYQLDNFGKWVCIKSVYLLTVCEKSTTNLFLSGEFFVITTWALQGESLGSMMSPDKSRFPLADINSRSSLL